MLGGAEFRERVYNAIFRVVIVVVGFLLGTVMTFVGTEETVAYNRAPACGEVVDRDCVRQATVSDWSCERRGDYEAGYTSWLRLGGPDRAEPVEVDADICYARGVGRELTVRWFRGDIVTVQRAGFVSVTDHRPEVPYFAALLGLLYWAAAFTLAVYGLVVALRRDIEDPVLAVGVFVGLFVLGVGVAYLVVAGILDGFLDVVHPYPRLVYVCVVLPPVVAVVMVVRVVLPAGRGGARRMRS